MHTHNAAVFFIVHFLYLQAVRLKHTGGSGCVRTSTGDANLSSLLQKHRVRPHQVFKLHVQVLSDGQLGVWYGLVEVSVQIVEHLHVETELVDNVLTRTAEEFIKLNKVSDRDWSRVKKTVLPSVRWNREWLCTYRLDGF